MGFVELLAEMEKERNDNRKPASAEELKSAYEQLETRHEFKPGDMVQWKPGLKSKNWPGYGEPALVVLVGGELGWDHTPPRPNHRAGCSRPALALGATEQRGYARQYEANKAS